MTTPRTRRVRVVLELETTLTVAQLRKTTIVGLHHANTGQTTWHFQSASNIHRLLRVQAEAVKAKKVRR